MITVIVQSKHNAFQISKLLLFLLSMIFSVKLTVYFRILKTTMQVGIITSEIIVNYVEHSLNLKVKNKISKKAKYNAYLL